MGRYANAKKEMMKDGFRKVTMCLVMDKNCYTGKDEMFIIETMEDAKHYCGRGQKMEITCFIKQEGEIKTNKNKKLVGVCRQVFSFRIS